MDAARIQAKIDRLQEQIAALREKLKPPPMTFDQWLAAAHESERRQAICPASWYERYDWRYTIDPSTSFVEGQTPVFMRGSRCGMTRGWRSHETGRLMERMLIRVMRRESRTIVNWEKLRLYVQDLMTRVQAHFEKRGMYAHRNTLNAIKSGFLYYGREKVLIKGKFVYIVDESQLETLQKLESVVEKLSSVGDRA